MTTVKGYNLSQEVDSDLESVFDYTCAEYGMDQAVSYLSKMEDLFFELVRHLELGKARNEVKPGLRSFPY